MTADQARSEAEGAFSARGVTWLGVVVNSVLSAVKITGGLLLGSQTLFVDGLHSASDLTTDAAVLLSLGVSGRPPDPAHPYGHRRVGTMVALAIGLVLAAAAVWIAWRALTALASGHSHRVVGVWAMILAAASIPAKEILYRLTMAVGRRTGDLAVTANAWHHRSDAFTSLAATAGLAGVAFGGPRWAFLDDVTALVLAAFLLIVAVRIAGQAVDELVDRAPSEATQAAIRRAVTAARGVRSFHAFRARRVGGRVAVDVHVQVDPMLTVRQGHDVAAAVKHRVLDADDHVVEVMVHIEPAEPNGADETSRQS